MDLYGKTLLEIKELIESKEITGKEAAEYFRTRSKELNKEINAYITITEKNDFNEESSGAGLPIAVKDNHCTKGVLTTAASKVLENFVPQYESTVTEKLKAEGFDIFAKANMDAWAHGSSGETSQFGPTKNPWDTNRAPGGSSSGSAAAVASYMAPAAIGSETAGSIRMPASWSGVVGFKPTYGRVSRYGVAAMGSSFDCPGPITLNVEDAAYILSIIAGKDSKDATSSTVEVSDYMQDVKKGETYTIGVARDYFTDLDDDIENALEDVIEEYKRQGHEVVDIELLDPEYSISVYTILQRAEVSSNLARLHGIRYSEDREKFGYEAKKRMMLGAYTLSEGYSDAYYKKALKIRTMIIDNFKAAFEKVDFILGPVAPITAIELGEFEKYPFFGELMDKFNEPSSIAGLPACSLPCGLDSNDLPIGFQLIGNYFDEGGLMDISYQYQEATDFNGVIKKGLEKWKNTAQ